MRDNAAATIATVEVFPSVPVTPTVKSCEHHGGGVGILRADTREAYQQKKVPLKRRGRAAEPGPLNTTPHANRREGSQFPG